jgi:hypothetical protein
MRSIGVASLLFTLLVACNFTGAGDEPDVEPPPPGTVPTGDYGDAPEGGETGYPELFAQDGSFPTLFDSNGARTLSIDEATLGPTASVEVDADDPADPDGAQNLTNSDSDDGLTDFFITLTAIPAPTTLSVDVVGPEGSPGGTFYINAVIDLNMDGEWGGRGANGELEWVVQNQPVQVAAGQTTPFTSPPFGFGNGNLLPDGAYMRIALTRETVPGNWDGTGEFSSGEIEDHFIRLPEIGGKKNPILSVDCGGPYAPGAFVICNVTNHRNVAGNFTYSLAKVAGGTVVVPLAGCVPGGPGGGPVAIGALGPPVPITCPSIVGTTPTTWRFTAKVKDPAAVVVDGGIMAGHTEESTADFDFEGSPKVWNVYMGGFQSWYRHFSGYSEVVVDLGVYGDDPVPMEGASVTLEMAVPGGAPETQTVVTDANGHAQAVFTISFYGDYVVSVVNIEGENMAYEPTMNALDSVEVNVAGAASTPVGVSPGQMIIEEFVAAYNAAFQAGDVEALFESLHPAVVELYGAEACPTYLDSVVANPIQLELLQITGPADWAWEIDGVSTDIEGAFTVAVNVTVQGETSESEVHFALREDGSIGWFTDCGDPLP